MATAFGSLSLASASSCLLWLPATQFVFEFKISSCFCLLGHAFARRSVESMLNLKSSWRSCLLLLAFACYCLLLVLASCSLVLAAPLLEFKFKISSCCCLLLFAWACVCTMKYGTHFELKTLAGSIVCFCLLLLASACVCLLALCARTRVQR